MATNDYWSCPDLTDTLSLSQEGFQMSYNRNPKPPYSPQFRQ